MDTVTLSEQATLDRFNVGQDRIEKDFGREDTKGALGITKDCIAPLKCYLESVIDELPTLSENNSEKEMLRVVRNLPLGVLALSTLGGALSTQAGSGTEIEAAQAIGAAIHGECWAAGLLEHNEELAGKIERAVRRRHGNLEYRKQAARSAAGRAGFRFARWDRDTLLKCGRTFLQYLLTALPDVFTLEEVEGYGKQLTVTDGGLATAERAIEDAMRAKPVFLPCTVAPAPWRGWAKGGYWDERSRFRASVVRTRYKETKGAINAALRSGAMKPHVDALNQLQSVAWSINDRVLGVLKLAYENDIRDKDGQPIKGLPPLTDLPIPKKPAAEWQAMDEAARTVWKREVAKTKQYNRAFKSARSMMKHDLVTASMMSEAKRFWTPLNCDFRGRVYGLCSLNYQRDDRVRALFLFADGAAIGEEGLRWLKLHVANCGDFGKISKASIEERIKWTDDNLERLEQMAAVPTKELWWTLADKPFLFVAAAMELVAALRTEKPSSYLTRLPVSFDGSCSGLQHLSAMTRDESTAKLVNLLPGETPQDVYETVAGLVRRRVQTDAATAETKDLATRWLDYGITRKLVKRNVMTYSYGSKKFGMAQQHMEDLMRPLEFDVLSGKLKAHPFGEDNGRAAAKYLAAITFDAIEGLVHRPAEAMKMLQKCARALAHEGKPVGWTTPLGLPWINRYHEPKLQTLNLWLHDARVRMVYADGHEPEIDKDRAANGSAPNFVHACDAAHLLLVASASACEDITQIATVHDSFGCLAPQAGRFRQIIREQFVKLYEHNDVLMQVLAQASHDLTVHNQQRLPTAPAMGKLNLSQIEEAEYAFA